MKKLFLIGALILSLSLVGCGKYEDGEIKVVVDGQVLQFEEPYKPFRLDGDTYVPAFLIPDVFNQKLMDQNGEVIDEIMIINDDNTATILDRTYMIPIDYLERYAESIEFHSKTNTYYITKLEKYTDEHDLGIWIETELIRELSEKYPKLEEQKSELEGDSQL